MSDLEKTVFISYRRDAAGFIARAIFMDLRSQGFDVFMDIESMDSGKFDTMLLNQIATRRHFIVILAPGTLERCADAQDWVRREIEHAMNTERNIVPLLVNSFSFVGTDNFLTGKLAELKRYNAVSVPIDFFDEAMERLRKRFLSQSATSSLTSPTSVSQSHSTVSETAISPSEEKVIEKQVEEIASQPLPTTDELSAEYHFGVGYSLQEQGNLQEAINHYSRAIELNPRYRRAYYNRALSYQTLKDMAHAERDYLEALTIEPDNAKTHHNLGIVWLEQQRYTEALEALNRAIKIDPDYAIAYLNRSAAKEAMGDIQGAAQDRDTYHQLGLASQVVGLQLNQSQETSMKSLLTFIVDGATHPLPEEKRSENHRDLVTVGMSNNVGLVHANNQDSCGFFVTRIESIGKIPVFGCFVVSDGMGGHNEGERASEIAVRIILNNLVNQTYLSLVDRGLESDRLSITEAMIKNINIANKEILANVPEGGATLTAVVIVGNLASIAHVGDTRAYLITHDGIEQLTRDHSVIQRLLELDQITIEEAVDHPLKNALYRALGQSDSVEVDTLNRRLPPGSSLLLCSDGVWSMVSEDELVGVVLENSPQDACDKLIALANERGGSDNISVIAIKMSIFAQ